MSLNCHHLFYILSLYLYIASNIYEENSFVLPKFGEMALKKLLLAESDLVKLLTLEIVSILCP